MWHVVLGGTSRYDSLALDQVPPTFIAPPPAKACRVCDPCPPDPNPNPASLLSRVALEQAFQVVHSRGDAFGWVSVLPIQIQPRHGTPGEGAARVRVVVMVSVRVRVGVSVGVRVRAKG